MVKLARGGRRQMLQGRPEPKPLFPPGKLPVFGPPPVNTRGPPIPRHQRQGYGPGPGMPHRPPPLMRPLPPMGPPLPPPPPPHRAGPPPLMGPHPPLPLMGGPPHGMMPRPPPHFMQGRRPLMRPRPGMGPPLKRLNKNFRKKQRRNKFDEEGEEETEWCEACDRGFAGKVALEQHLAEHEVCGRDGCPFQAHPRVVQVHVRMQHRTGLFSKMAADQQDVNKWIEQRKRNYPTLENIEKKRQMQEEMEQRGERLNDDGDKKLPKRNLGHQKRGMNRKGRGNNRLQRVKRFEQQMKEGEEQSLRKKRKLDAPKFTSLISTVPEEAIVDNAQPDKDSWSDGEWSENRKEASPEPLPVNSSLLALTSYDSDPASDHEPKGLKNVNEGKEKESGEESGPEEVSLEKRKEESKAGTQGGPRAAKRKDKGRPGPRQLQPRLPKEKQLTLLEKLLKNEIRHERNVILQCIRYIVSRNFFEEDSTTCREISNPLDKCENSTAV